MLWRDRWSIALRRLEYRGYDSAASPPWNRAAGAAARAEGKLSKLQLKLLQNPLAGAIGIGHTRWATHGRPNETNAHPHATERLAVVHNGIIENFRELKAELAAEGCVFETETDTEVVAQLVTHLMRSGLGPGVRRRGGPAAPARCLRARLPVRRRGGLPDRGPPWCALALGFGDGETYLGSDALALAPFTDEITYLDEGDGPS